MWHFFWVRSKVVIVVLAKERKEGRKLESSCRVLLWAELEVRIRSTEKTAGVEGQVILRAPGLHKITYIELWMACKSKSFSLFKLFKSEIWEQSYDVLCLSNNLVSIISKCIILTLPVGFKLLKSIYFTSDACTSEILNFFNLYNINSSSKKYYFVYAKKIKFYKLYHLSLSC